MTRTLSSAVGFGKAAPSDIVTVLLTRKAWFVQYQVARLVEGNQGLK
jgi:hypothetical protein